MHKTIMWVLIALAAALSSGCIVATPNRGRPAVVKERGCGPAHHWNGSECVHNGHGHGHDD